LREFGEYDEALTTVLPVTDTRTGLRSMQIAFTPVVRVVCQNTLVYWHVTISSQRVVDTHG
jgi:hypothetical protein